MRYGRVKWNVAPPALLFSAHSSPPYASIMFLEMASPIPSPSSLEVKNGSKTARHLAFLNSMPGVADKDFNHRSGKSRAHCNITRCCRTLADTPLSIMLKGRGWILRRR